MKDQSPDAQGSDLPGYREELAAEIAVKKLLIRIRLEDAARAPFKSVWTLWFRCFFSVAIISLGFIPGYQHVFTTFVVVSLLSGNGESEIHSRIDAILKLAELDKNEAQAAVALADEPLK